MSYTCDFCKQAIIDVNAFKYGYVDGYNKITTDALNQLRDDICKHKHECPYKEDGCVADELLNIIDNDKDIKSKKGE